MASLRKPSLARGPEAGEAPTCRWKWDEHPVAIGSLPLFLICICAIIVADDKGWLEPNKASVNFLFSKLRDSE